MCSWASGLGPCGHPVLLPESPGSAVSVAPFPLPLVVAELCVIGAGVPIQGAVGLGPGACRNGWILLLPFPERPRGKAGLPQFPLWLRLKAFASGWERGWGSGRVPW